MKEDCGKTRVVVQGFGSLQNPFAITDQGLCIHVRDLDINELGPFSCPGCRDNMIIKRGEIRRHHFAHASGAICHDGIGASLRAFSRQLLATEKCMTLPALTLTVKARTVCKSPMKLAEFDAVDDKKCAKLQPDIVFTLLDGRARLAVILVTGPSKAGHDMLAAQSDRISTVAIDLQNLPQDALDDPVRLAETILHTAPRSWIYHRREDHWRSELQEEERDRATATSHADGPRDRPGSAGYRWTDATSRRLFGPGKSWLQRR